MAPIDLPGITEPGAAAPRRGKAPRHWADLDPADRAAAVTQLGLPRFRADQLSRRYFAGAPATDPQQWTDVPLAERATVAQEFFPVLLEPVQRLTTDAGDTVKTVWRLTGGALVESVVMAYPRRVTACISSQAGCGIGCPFCATGQGGLRRNLSTAEIVEQVRDARGMAAAGAFARSPDHLTNIVFMGMGEPLANYRNVVAALHRILDPVPAGFDMSARNVVVSTVGLVPRMHDLADEGLPVTLALSLHAPDDELRDTLVPINSRWPVAEVVAAADAYAARTGRRYSIEYALIRDINDQPHRARLLASLLVGRLAHVNLIPLNPTPGSQWTASDPGVQDEFVRLLREAGVSTTVRDTRGREIDGACGQLAATVTPT